MAGYTKGSDGRYQIPLVDFGHRLQDNFGLRVREHSAFGGVNPVHAPNSYHNHDEALDITDWRDDNLGGVHWKDRTKNLASLLKGSGPEVLGPGFKGHDTHVHLAAKNGILSFDENQYRYFFGGESGGKDATFSGFKPATGVTDDGAPAPASAVNPDHAEAHDRAQQYITRARTAGEVVEGLGNDFGQMKSQALGDHLRSAQEAIIQKRMDAGESFGSIQVPQQPKQNNG